MTLLIPWDHVHDRERKTPAYARTVLKIAKGALVAAGIVAATVAIVALRVYLFVPALH